MTAKRCERGDLSGVVALVAGATRGAGRGVAVELGRAGATVVVTGRTTRDHDPGTYGRFLSASGMASMPGTVEDTVDEIVDEGGQAIGVRCDHGDPAQVAGLIEMIAATYGRLDVLVNNAWGGHEGFAPDAMGAPLWDQPLEQWDAMMTNGVRNHLVTLQHAAPLMCTRGGRLIAAITFCDEGRYLSGNVFYDLAKHVINRIAFAAATELRDDAIASVAVSPGFMRTELVLAHLHTTEATFRERSELASSETPHYLGRAVVALADDPDVFDQTGRVLTVAELARRYGFTDLDGTQPAAFQVAAVGDGPAGNR